MTSQANNTASKSKDSGSFLTGLSVGLFAGSAAFFLFGTDKGKKLKDDLAKEWEKAKDTMVEKGVIENKYVGIRDVLRSVFSQVGAGQASLDKSTAASKKQTKKSSKSTSKKKTTASKKQSTTGKKKPQKFKGV